MRINTKFPVAIHILSFIAIAGEKYSTSENLSKSVNTNPVVIRRINALLKKANLISVVPGIGGAKLNRDPDDITLLDIYNAVVSESNDTIFDLNHNPNPSCVIGANINNALSEPLSAAQQGLENVLNKYTLRDIISQIPKHSNKK